MIKRCLAWLAAALMFISSSSQALVILQYHHVSESTPKITSVTPEQFRQQMTYLKEQQFAVISLEQALAALRSEQPLPHKSVVISFDDAYQNVVTNAVPLLQELEFPYTIFVNIEAVEQKRRNTMSWETLRQLGQQGATIANHSYRHAHLIRRQAGEEQQQWQQRVRADIEQSEAKISAETGDSVKALAYPYGEFNPALQALIAEMGYVGIGQHSGAIGAYSDLTALPRFPVAGPYADLNTLKVKLHSLNMPVVALDGAGSELIDRPRPSLTVTIDNSDVRTKELMCYVQGQGAKVPTWLDETTFTIQADLPLPAGRSRYNCTAPSKTKDGYYWFSQPWVQAYPDGSWPED